MSSGQSVTPFTRGRRSRRFRCRGSEIVEFSLVLLPLFAMTAVLVDTAWAIFAKSALQRAVRMGVREGVTLTAGQMGTGSCLTDTVKSVVQSNALGILHGSSGLGMVKVHYYLPSSTGASPTDVSGQANGNAPGNIMVVSVQNYSLIPLLPRIYNWRQGADTSPMTLNVSSADLIEPSVSPPCIGTAP